MNTPTIKQFRERVKRVMAWVEAIQDLPKKERLELIRRRMKRVINKKTKQQVAKGDYSPRRKE